MKERKCAYRCEGCGKWLDDHVVIHEVRILAADKPVARPRRLWHEVEIRYHGEFDHYEQCGPVNEVTNHPKTRHPVKPHRNPVGREGKKKP